MSDIVKRLRASVAFNAVDGDAMERSVCKRQMIEAANEIEARDSRIRELEDRLHERDLAVAALTQDRDEAYDSGVRDGIERVRKAVMSMPANHFLGTMACEDALDAYEKEVEHD